jgi:anti-anti-sigma factor
VKITVKEEPDQMIVGLSGDDSNPEAMEEFKRVMQMAVHREVLTPLTLDLSELYYLGSEGVGVIAAAHKAFLEKKSKITVLNPTRQVSRVFMVTRLDSYLHIRREGDSGAAKVGPTAAQK